MLMTIKNAFASVPVKDVNAAAEWYSQLLERPAERPMEEVAEWQFDGGGGLQAYELPERAGGGSVTLAVNDIEGHAEAVKDLGIADASVSSNPGVKTLMIKDPDGNSIAFAEVTDSALMQ
jgi:predicted enzyme related to lactoylglutathione lyase